MILAQTIQEFQGLGPPFQVGQDPGLFQENATILGHLLFGVAVHALRVSDVFVAGEPVLRNGAFVRVDEAAELAHAREQASALWRRVERGGAR